MGRKDKPISDTTNSLQARMRQARQAKNISLTELAERAGFTKGYLSSVENGNGTPSMDVILAYERELELDEGTLMSLLGNVAAPRGRRHRLSTNGTSSSLDHQPHVIKNKDIVNAPVIKQFYGRKEESANLKKWVIDDRCTLVSIVGMAGIGKTSLVARFIGQIDKKSISNDFDYITWYSLQDDPSVRDIIERFNDKFFSDQPLTAKTGQPIDILIELFSRNRCLLVLDDFENVFADKKSVGGSQYKEQRADYAKLLQRVGEGNHQSCLILMSRERPGEEIRRIEGPTLPVRSMELTGLTAVEEVQSFLEGEKLFGSRQSWKELIERYSGNPLALKLISISIREVFGGDIATFLSQGETTFGDLSTLVEEQFERLSDDERYLIYWLAIERGSVSLEDLKKDVAPRLSTPGPLGIINSLKQRFLIDFRGPNRVALQPIVVSYVTNQLIQNVCDEILNKKELGILSSHALVKALVEDHMRHEQIQHLLVPIKTRLVEHLGTDGVEQRLTEMLKELQDTHDVSKKIGYTAGNILNLLVNLKDGDLRNFDFSRLTIQQSNLQRATLHDVNFSYSDLSTSVFMETFRGVTSLALGPDGKLLAAGTITGEIWVWDITTGQLKSTYKGDASWVCWSVTFSPDGRWLAGGYEDTLVRLWDVQSGIQIKELTGHMGSVRSVAFSPDSKLLVSGSEDKCAILWDVSTVRAAKLLQTLEGHQGSIWAVAFHPHTNKMMLATGSDDGSTILWNVQTGEQLWTLPEKPSVYNQPIYALAFSPNGKLLASGGKDCTVRIWDVDTGESHHMLEGHTDWVWSVAFSRDSDTIASGSEDSSVRLWDVRTGTQLRTLSGHTGRVWAVAFHAEQDIFVSGGIDRTIRFWNVQRGDCLRVLQGYMNGIRSIAYNPHSKILASAGDDYNIYLWKSNIDDHDNADIPNHLRYKMLTGHTNVVWAIAFHPDGQLLVTGGDDKTLRFWNAQSGTLLDTRLEHDAWIRTIAFSPDGERFASGGEDGVIHLWNTKRRAHTAQIPGHKAPIRAIAFHPDKTLLASGGEDGRLFLRQLDGSQWTELRRQEQSNTYTPLTAHDVGIWSLAFSLDGKLLASGSEDQTIRLWDVRSGRNINTLEDDSSWIGSVAFHPLHPTLLVSGGGDTVVRLWNIKTGQVVATMRGHSAPVSSLVFISDDGSRLASGSHDGTIIIWDTQSGKAIHKLQADRPYERMNISHVRGLNAAQIRMLTSLGAVSGE